MPHLEGGGGGPNLEVSGMMKRTFGLRIDGYWAPDKDPDAVLDYCIDWGDWLGDDQITTSNWAVSPGITASGASKTETTVTIWLSGGEAGETYTVHNRITTAGGRTNDQSFKISCVEK
jgi:hypothetical protein